MLPWNEMETLQLETQLIKQELVQMNEAGYLTINSQPAVNGASSTDSKFGWGGPHGQVFFLSRTKALDVPLAGFYCCIRDKSSEA